jgi:Cu/Ag efflux protein CusF
MTHTLKARYHGSSVFSSVAVAGLCIWLTACGSKPSQTEQPAQQPAQAQTPAPAPAGQPAQAQPPQKYDLKGKIVSVDKGKMQLEIAGEAIPGFMGAMTMPYTVKSAGSLDGLKPGDQITANVMVNGTDVWVENIVVVNKGGLKPAI